MQAHSGVDPLGSFNSFLSKDAITNIDLWKDKKQSVNAHLIQTDFGFMKDRVPVGTKTFTYLTDKLE